MSLREDLVYVATKRALIDRGWLAIAGQPPRGTNHLPVLEIKDPLRAAKGSLGAFKPDLVVVKGDWLLLGECKPELDLVDVEKLRSIIASPTRLRELAEELVGRGLPGATAKVGGFVANGSEWRTPLQDIGMVSCRSIYEAALIPANEWSPELSGWFS